MTCLRPVLAAALTLAAPLPALAQSGGADASPLDWMNGCWTNERGDAREVWSAFEGGLKFGYSVAIKDGEAAFFEDLRIDLRGEKAVYIAMPNGEGPTVFRESDRTGVSITFENADHDYPQRIEYGANRVALVAKISKLDGSAARTFSMYRCEAADE